MDLECKEIAKKMRQQANEAGQGNEEELESRIQNAIEKHKDENYEMFDSEIDSESDESGNEAEMNIYKKPNMIKRWGLPRLYNEHAKPDSREQKYTNSSLYHPNFDQSNLIIESKGNAILGGGFAIFRPAVSIGLYKDRNWRGKDKFESIDSKDQSAENLHTDGSNNFFGIAAVIGRRD